MHMRKIKTAGFTLLTAITMATSARAQSFEHAGQYLDYIGKANEKVSSLYLSYLSAVGHGKSARKVDKRRQEVVTNLFNTRLDIQGLPPWKGDRSYRDTTVNYLKLLYAVFNEDYAKIVNMEEIAEQSYDAMEAYMLAQEKAGEKLHEAADRRQKTFREFATKYNVNVLESTTELEQKSNQANELMKHYDQVFLVFFKAQKQEGYLLSSIGEKKLTALEQNRSALKKFADEGMEKLKTFTGYQNDTSLMAACRTALDFFREEADRMQFATDFLMTEEAFARLKKNFESKSASQRTQKDIDEFNKGVADINAAINTYNSTNNAVNKARDKALATWNGTVKKYLDEYMPYQRKG
jgi:hypothetical protein